MTFPQVRQYLKHPVPCIDCHDPQTMQLRITRPAFVEANRALKASHGVPNYDVKIMAIKALNKTFPM